jgi:hypothetical protein
VNLDEGHVVYVWVKASVHDGETVPDSVVYSLIGE